MFPFRSYLLLLCWGFGLSLSGQQPVFRQHPLKDLSGPAPAVLAQDRNGWIWLGGDGGLLRYDGWEYQRIVLPEGLDEQVTAIYPSRDRIWLGFGSGQIGWIAVGTAFHARKNADADGVAPASVVQIWMPEEGTPTRPVIGFAEDKKGQLWIATYGEGLYCWSGERLYQFNSADDGLISDDIYAIASDQQGRIWVGTDGGISICDMPSPGQKQMKHLLVDDGLPDEIVTSLLPDSSGGMWIGTYDRGICRYDYERSAFELPAGDWTAGRVTGMALFGRSELWVATEGSGCLRISLAVPAFPDMRQKAVYPAKKIRSLLKDREGLLWAIDERGGVFSANVRFGLLPTPSQEVQAVWTDRSDRLWAGTSSGLFLHEKGFFRRVTPKEVNVLSLAETPGGNILAGSYGQGLWLLAPGGEIKAHFTERDGLPNNSIYSISVGADGTIWLATLGGVASCRLDDLRKPRFTILDAVGGSYVYCILLDRKGRLWFGTEGKGLYRMQDGALKHYTSLNGHPLKTVHSIIEDRRGSIWLTTPEDGLWMLAEGQTRHYGMREHLHSNEIVTLCSDGNGLLVLGYADGLDLLNPETGHVAFISQSAGLPAADINFNASHRGANGDVWLGCAPGILRVAAFDEFFHFDPAPSLTAVSVLMEAVDFTATQSFAHDENYFMFDFTGLWYTNPEAVRFRYRLEGYDPGWKVTKDHQASYSNLPPRRYTFRVQTSEHGTFEHTPEVAYSFLIQRPYWTRWWFVLLVGCLVGGLLFWWIRNRDRRFRREALLKKEKADSQFAALKSQINPHFLFNSFNTLITVIEENPGLAVQYVEHLSDFYRSMMAYREKDLIPLQEEMRLVGDFYFLLQRRFEQNFTLETRLNGATGLVMPLSLQMLVENAVKHNIISRAHPLQVEIFVENNQWVVVRNNIQLKISPEPSTHFGLQSLVQRYQLLDNRKVVIEQTDRYFIVKVPLIQAS